MKKLIGLMVLCSILATSNNVHGMDKVKSFLKGWLGKTEETKETLVVPEKIDNQPARLTFNEHEDDVMGIAFHNGYMFSYSYKTIKKWHPDKDKSIQTFNEHEGSVNGIVFHNGFMFSCSSDGTIDSWIEL